jgi:hypothetical protein
VGSELRRAPETHPTSSRALPAFACAGPDKFALELRQPAKHGEHEHATQRHFVYAHTWRQQDLVMWDNRQTMHRARRYKETSEVRDTRRTTLEGDGPTTLQMAVA